MSNSIFGNGILPELAVAHWIFEPPLQFYRLVWNSDVLAEKTLFHPKSSNIFNIVFINSTCLRPKCVFDIGRATCFYGKSMTQRFVCVCQRNRTSNVLVNLFFFLFRRFHQYIYVIYHPRNLAEYLCLSFKIHNPALFKPVTFRPRINFRRKRTNA